VTRPPLAPAALRELGAATPYVATDLDMVAGRLAAFRAALPGVRVHYAMKCNRATEVLRTLRLSGAGFEVASLGELRELQALGVDPAGVLYSNPVKPAAHIASAYEAGLWRFSFDSPHELAKIAENAPGAAVYVRLRVDDRDSVFPLSRKFGTDLEDAYDLLLLAERLGLRPYGITFHVGSQCVRPGAWADAIDSAGKLMDRLRHDDITLEMLDLGGGFPARYTEDVPSIEEIGAITTEALDALPYRPGLIVAEPGRCLVAESAVIATTVIGHERRGEENWLYVEVGAFNGLMEVLQAPGGWHYPMASLLSGTLVPYTVTGPTCDSGDTIGYGVMLPAGLVTGDVLYLGSTGAYTMAYASAFNGFEPPTPIFIGPDRGRG
jgi:ornithine decarboxylase